MLVFESIGKGAASYLCLVVSVLGLLGFNLAPTGIGQTDKVSAQSPAFCEANDLRFYEGSCVTEQEYSCLSTGGAWESSGGEFGQAGASICSCPERLLDGECVSQTAIECELTSGGTVNSNGDCICPQGQRLSIDSLCVTSSVNSSNACEVNDSFLGIPTWYRGLDFNEDNCEFVISSSDFDRNDNTNPVIIIVINITAILSRIAGIIAVIFVIAGGFKYVLSDGDPQKTAEARKTIINALIGAFIVAIAAAIVDLIHRGLT